jgi:hypothetical protein
MKRTLIIKDGGIVSGEIKEDLVIIFPSIESKFTQRKTYWEFYYSQDAIVEFTLEDIQKLNDAHYSTKITSDEIIIY